MEDFGVSIRDDHMVDSPNNRFGPVQTGLNKRNHSENHYYDTNRRCTPDRMGNHDNRYGTGTFAIDRGLIALDDIIGCSNSNFGAWANDLVAQVPD